MQGARLIRRVKYFRLGPRVGDVRHLAAELHLDDVDELGGIDRLDEQRRQLVFAQFAHLMLDLIGRHTGEQDDGQRLAVFLEVVQHIEAVDVGHLQVEQHEVDLAVLKVLQRGFTVAGFIDVVTGAAEIMGEGKSFDGGIVAEQESRTTHIARWHT